MSAQPPAKIALVTGAARRIGRKIAETLAADGFDIALHTSARSLADAENFARELKSGGTRVFVTVADLASAAETAEIMPAVQAALGPVMVLVNNASIFEADSAGGVTPAGFDLHQAVNLRAPVCLAAALAAALPEGAAGNIINIIDQRVWRLNPNFFSYTLSKAGLWTATQTMAQAFAPRIRVNAVGPGPAFANARQQAGDFDRQGQGVLLRRTVDPADIAEAVLYLLRARSVTGQMLAVDAGQHLAWETPDVAGIAE